MTSGVLHKLCPLQDLQQATTLHFEFYSDVQQAGQGAAGHPDATAVRGTQGGLTIINLPGLHRYSESEHAILERLVKRFKVPQRLRYSRVSAPRVGCLRRLPVSHSAAWPQIPTSLTSKAMLPSNLQIPAADRCKRCPKASACKLQTPGWRLHLLHKTHISGHRGHAPGCRFQLLACIHRARSSGSLEGRRQLVRVRLLAFYVLFQSSPSTEDLAAFFNQEPDFVSELAAILRAENTVPEDVRWAVAHEAGFPMLLAVDPGHTSYRLQDCCRLVHAPAAFARDGYRLSRAGFHQDDHADKEVQS